MICAVHDICYHWASCETYVLHSCMLHGQKERGTATDSDNILNQRFHSLIRLKSRSTDLHRHHLQWRQTMQGMKLVSERN